MIESVRGATFWLEHHCNSSPIRSALSNSQPCSDKCVHILVSLFTLLRTQLAIFAHQFTSGCSTCDDPAELQNCSSLTTLAAINTLLLPPCHNRCTFSSLWGIHGRRIFTRTLGGLSEPPCVTLRLFVALARCWHWFTYVPHPGYPDVEA